MKKLILTLTLLAATSHMFAILQPQDKLKALGQTSALVKKGLLFEKQVTKGKETKKDYNLFRSEKLPEAADTKINAISMFEDSKTEKFKELRIMFLKMSHKEMKAKGKRPLFSHLVRFKVEDLENPLFKAPLMGLIKQIKLSVKK